MKEAKGSQFVYETENTAKILHRAFIFRHAESLLKKISQTKETGLHVDFLLHRVLFSFIWLKLPSYEDFIACLA